MSPHVNDVTHARPPPSLRKFPGTLVNKLTENIDIPENVLMVHSSWRSAFNLLGWCFVPPGMHLDSLDGTSESDSRPQCYEIKWVCPRLPQPVEEAVHDIVVFDNHDSDSESPLPVPHPKLLAVYAAIVHALNMSGAEPVFHNLARQFRDYDTEAMWPRSAVLRDLGGDDVE
ncbi:hypothetical protein EIP91_001299 [Steccherinum ochraceum]|uniref:HNH nuclease domain-containing protein n=1 Tax=Steccherinum ochraceum TaxID=92696 RepID=A0A4R0RIA8_9APHY|nr:hypothetical protein EIP91_001299 [Steccherinum ochraceum]